MPVRTLTLEERKPLLDFQEYCHKELIGRPLVVAALSPEFSESYKCIGSWGFANLIVQNRGRLYYEDFCLALMVYWIRRFYEESNGMESHLMLGVTQAMWKTFLRTCRESACCKPWADDKAFPQRGQDTQEWLRHQCWLIKASERGRCAARLKCNASVYNCLQDSFFSAVNMGWGKLFTTPREELESQLEDLELLRPYFESDQAFDSAVHIFSVYKLDYLVSLKAVAAELVEKPEKFPSQWAWLENIWGIGKCELKRASQNTPNLRAVWKLVLNGGALELWLKITCSADMDVVLQQAGKTIREGLGNGSLCSVRDLVERGFDIEQPLEVRGSMRKRATIARQLHFCANSWTLFRAAEATLAQNDEWECDAGNVYVRPQHTFWLIHKRGEQFEATLDGMPCLPEGRLYMLVGDYAGERFCFPKAIEHPYGADFIVNGRYAGRFVEKPDINILDSGVPDTYIIDETDIQGVGAEHRLAAGGIRFKGAGCFEKDGESAVIEGPFPDENAWMIPLGASCMHQPGVALVHRRGGKVVWKQDFFVLQENWRELIVPDSLERRYNAIWNLKMDAALYTIPETCKQVHLLVPHEKPFCCWVSNGRDKAFSNCRHDVSDLLDGWKIKLFLPNDGDCVKLIIFIDDRCVAEKLCASSGNQNARIKNCLREILETRHGRRIRVQMDDQEILSFNITSETLQQLRNI